LPGATLKWNFDGWIPNTELDEFFVWLCVCLLYVVDDVVNHMVDYKCVISEADNIKML
jgi:hypothetical protein